MNLSWGLLHAGLQTVLDTALDAVVVMGEDDRVIGWNAKAEQSFGWSADEALGAKLSELIIPPQYREAHEKGLAHYLATGEGPVLNQHIEITALHREGHEIPIELSITASATSCHTCPTSSSCALASDSSRPENALVKLSMSTDTRAVCCAIAATTVSMFFTRCSDS